MQPDTLTAPSHKPSRIRWKDSYLFQGVFPQRVAVYSVIFLLSFLYALSIGHMEKSLFLAENHRLLSQCVNAENMTKARKLKCDMVQNGRNSDIRGCYITVAGTTLIPVLSKLWGL